MARTQRTILRCLLCAAALWIPVQDAAAQGVGPAPRGGAFGRPLNTQARQNLDVTLALADAYDSVAQPVAGIPQTGPQQGGLSWIGMGSLNYIRAGRRVRLEGSAFSTVRYFHQVDKLSTVGNSAALGAIVTLAGNTRLTLNQTGDYSPSYFYRLFPSVVPPDLGDITAPGPDYRLHELKSYAFTTRATLSAGAARGHQASLEAERSRTDFLNDTPARPMQDVLAGRARWSHGVGRTGLLSTEYEYREGEFGYGGRAREQRLRIGGQVSPALSGSRRLTLQAGLAPSQLVIPDTATNAAVTGTLYRLEGDATVTYPVSLRWNVGATYRRGVEYIAVFTVPVFRDSGQLVVSGLLTRQLDLEVSAGIAEGQSALNRNSPSFDTYTGRVTMRYALSRPIAIYSEYLYYYYDLGRMAALAPDLPRAFEQSGVRVGLMVWARPVGR